MILRALTPFHTADTPPTAYRSTTLIWEEPDYQYQRALNQMIIIFFMVGRMTEGDYTLPTIAR